MARARSALALLLPCAAAAASARGRGGAWDAGKGFLAEGLRPEVVAKTLAQVEDEWQSQAATFAECSAHSEALACRSPQQAFGKSCATVVDAIVRGSSGDQDRAREYMGEVCAQKALVGWHRDRCLDLQRAMDGVLRFNAFANRMNFDSAKLCEGFWRSFSEAERKRAEAERAAQKDMLLKASARRQALAEQKEKEEAHLRALEAQRAKVEAQQQAAAKLAHKKAEAAAAHAKAEALAAAARENMRRAAVEAARAAEEHRQRLLEHKKAEERLRQITIAHQKAKANASSQAPQNATSKMTNSSHEAAPSVKLNVAPTNKTIQALPKAPATNATEKAAVATNSTGKAVKL